MPVERDPMDPALYRVVANRRETSDVSSLTLAPLKAEMAVAPPRHGQFNMLTAFGVGEAAISVSRSSRLSGRDSGQGLHTAGAGSIVHTIRDVGAVTHALCVASAGSLVGVRGPFGQGWGAEDGDWLAEGDVVVVAGGIGLAPLRSVVDDLAGRSTDASGRLRGRLFVIAGAREQAQVIFADDLARWAALGAIVSVTVDVSTPGWTGHVGLVTAQIAPAGIDPGGARALVCGPEIMMRFTAAALEKLGMDPSRIFVSLERNMQCGLGWCGHCQLGPLILCRDGPIVAYGGAVTHLMRERER